MNHQEAIMNVVCHHVAGLLSWPGYSGICLRGNNGDLDL